MRTMESIQVDLYDSPLRDQIETVKRGGYYDDENIIIVQFAGHLEKSCLLYLANHEGFDGVRENDGRLEILFRIT